MALEISPPSGPLPTALPNLMPFHVEYTGPAPISRYFCPKPAPNTFLERSLTSTSSTVTSATASSSETQSNTPSLHSFVSNATSATTVENIDAESTKCIAVETSREVTAVLSTPPDGDVMDVELAETQESSFSVAATIRKSVLDASRKRVTSAVERFVAAFRGRRICGQAVCLPDGYGGLVLQASSLTKGKGENDGKPSASKPQFKAKPKSIKGRTTRRSTRSKKVEEEDENLEVDEEGTSQQADASVEVRKLIPASTFSSFTIWSPDIPVDEGRDEYMRSLIEWTKLAAEIHSCED
ncbi:ribonuclease H2, subunit C [Phlebopus sp. FC_14]|nr:ribonuclease H2, subunit C [Phlebopus sp. FC_14]